MLLTTLWKFIIFTTLQNKCYSALKIIRIILSQNESIIVSYLFYGLAVKVCLSACLSLPILCNPKLPSQPFACTSICHCFICCHLPLHSRPPIHQASLLWILLITPLSSTLPLSPYYLVRLPLSFTVTPLPPREPRHRKGQLTDLKTLESTASQGLGLICINLHNLIKAAGDAVHTVPWDT